MAALPKILVTTTSFPRWKGDAEGGGSFLLELYSRFADDFEVHVLAPFFKGAPLFSEIGKIKVHRYRFFPFNGLNLINASGLAETLNRQKWKLVLVPFLLLFQLVNIWKLVGAKKISIIHANWIIPQGLVAAFYKKLLNRKIKILLTSHGSDLNVSFGSAGTALVSFALKNADVLAAVSNSLCERAKQLGFTKEVEVIPMGIDTKLFKPVDDVQALRSKLQIKKWMLLFVGYFNEVKGIEYILHALPEILKSHPETTLVLVGDGILKDKLKRMCEELQIQEAVKFTGLLRPDELPAYYSAADIVLMPSLSEGSPVVLPEAMSCGAIVIASDLPVYKEHIRNGENGFIVRQKNSTDIAEKVKHLLSRHDEFLSIKNMNRQYISERFDWDVIASRYRQLLNSIG